MDLKKLDGMRDEEKIRVLDEVDDSLFNMIQLIGNKVGVSGITNDEFDNELVAELRHEILGYIEDIEKGR